MKLDIEAILTGAFTNIAQGQIVFVSTLDDKDKDKHISDGLDNLKALAARYERIAATKDFGG